MSIARIYQPVSLQPGARIHLTDAASHHLSRVLRANLNDAVTLFNGEGGEYQTVIAEINKKGVIVTVNEFLPREAESPIQIHLLQGVARGEKMDFIVQKAVELGVNTITPVVTERCNVRLDKEREAKRLQHWQAVITSACEQSGRNRVPELLPTQSLSAALESVQADVSYVLSPHVTKKLSETQTPPSRIALLIGPEGGLSENEIKLAISAGFISLNLGPRVLRTETAALAAIAALQYRYGDFR